MGTDAAGDNVIVSVLCRIDDSDITTSGHSEMELSMATEVELALPDPDRIMPDSPASCGEQ